VRLILTVETGGNRGRASHISAGRGGEGGLSMHGASSAPKRSSSLTYALGRSLVRRRMEELKGWQAVGVELIPRDASEKLDERLAIEMGLLEGVEPRIDVKDMMVDRVIEAS
jgi:hypothetical protein